MASDHQSALPDYDKGAGKIWMRVLFLLILKYSLLLLMAWGFIWGALVITLRLAINVDRILLLWGGLGIVPAVAAAAWISLTRMPEKMKIKSLLDGQSRCGGLFMAAQEAEIGNWRNRIPKKAPISLQWRGGRCWGLFGMSMAFVLIAFLLPQRFMKIAGAGRLDIDDEIRQMTEQVETLEEENIIEEASAEELEKKLEDISREAQADDPVKTWEAMDHMEEKLSNLAKEAAQAALSQTEKAALAQALAEALMEAGDSLDAEAQAEAMSLMAALMQQALAENETMQNNLDSEALNNLSAEDLAKLSEMLGAFKMDLKDMVANLVNAQLIDFKVLGILEGLCECNCQGLGEFLAKEGYIMLGQNMADLAGYIPGGFGPSRWGIDRGRGDAPLTITDPSSDEGVKWKEQILPPASLASLKDSKAVGVSLGAPTVTEAGNPGQSGALAGAATGGGTTNRQVILPQHRSAVQRYFDRIKKK